MSDRPPIELIERYKIAVETRQFEIQMFWQRSNHFILVNSAIAAGYFASRAEPFLSIGVTLLGVVTCCCWFAVNLGSKFWQIRWEEAAARIEREASVSLFSTPMDEMKEAVRDHQVRSKHGFVQATIDCLVLKKPSVSFAMMIMSGAFVVFWLAIFIVSLSAIWTKNLPI